MSTSQPRLRRALPRPTGITSAGRRGRVGLRLAGVVAVGLPVLALAMVHAVGTGPVPIPPGRVVATIAQLMGIGEGATLQELSVVGAIRLPRVVVGALVGLALGVAGVAMQGTFRNPLAEPGVIGVSAGGALGAVGAIYFGLTRHGSWVIPALAFLGSLLAVAFVFVVSRTVRRGSEGTTMLLIGIGVNAFLGAAISIMVATAPREDDLRSIMFWLQGGLDARTWRHAAMAWAPIVLGTLTLLAFSRDLNIMSLGDDQSASSGVDLKRSRLVILVLAALVTASAVAVSGTISFVGLVVPHVLRLLLGPDHRVLLPASALGGAAFLVVADVAARMAFDPVTIQVGTVTALVGAPVLLFSILRGQVR